MTEPSGPSTPSDPGDEAVPASAAEPTPTSPAPQAAPRAKRPRRLLLGLVAAVVVVAVGVIGYLVFFQKSDPTSAKVDDCVSISGPASLATASRLSCDDDKALYVVTAAGKTVTCDAHEVSYSGSNRDRTKLCLFYNVRVGECLKVTQNGDGDAKASCATGMLKVLSVRTDTADKTQCPAQADEARADPTRNRLICFATVR
jgi:hypothetical protein